MTYRFAINSILKSLKNKTDDADITEAHALYWIGVVANKYMAKDLEKGKRSGAYLSIFNSVTVHKDENLQQHYIDLPRGLIHIDHDAGVEFITYNRKTCCCSGPAWAQTNFSGTTAGALETLYGDKYTKPTTKNPYYYHVGGSVDGVNVDRLYLDGTWCIHLKDVKIGIYAAVSPKDICDLDDNIPVKSKYDDTILREVMTLGRFMLLIPEERVNDGADGTKPIRSKVPRASRAEITDQEIEKA